MDGESQKRHQDVQELVDEAESLDPNNVGTFAVDSAKKAANILAMKLGDPPPFVTDFLPKQRASKPRQFTGYHRHNTTGGHMSAAMKQPPLKG